MAADARTRRGASIKSIPMLLSGLSPTAQALIHNTPHSAPVDSDADSEERDEMAEHGEMEMQKQLSVYIHKKEEKSEEEFVQRAAEAMARQGDASPKVGKGTHKFQDQALLMHLLQERGHGSALRGWRLELDPSGNLYATFADFCKAAARLKFAGDALTLFGGDGDNATLALNELSIRLGTLMDKFKGWLRDLFRSGTPRKTMRLGASCYKKLFDACDVRKEGKVFRPIFLATCQARACPLVREELNEVFDLCDYLDRGWVSAEDMIVIEPDKQVRDLAMFVRNISNRSDLQDSLAKDYIEHLRLKRGTPGSAEGEPKPQTAPRPWRRHSFERHHVQYENLPHVLCHRRRERQAEKERRQATAKEVFQEHIQSFYGNEVRMMRRGLDVQATFYVDWTRLRHYCRKHNLDLNAQDLWRALDRDCDGKVTFWEFCGSVAIGLAKLLAWARERYGSTVGLWDCKEAAELRRQCRQDRTWPSDKTMQFAKFNELLRSLGWPGASEPSISSLLRSSLDACNCGLISRQDLEWIDGWDPPLWLLSKPDPLAWIQVKEMLLREYKHLLRAWRILDQGDTNCLSWSAFQHALSNLGFKGNVAGAWCAADDDRSGMISIEEFDPGAAKMLLSFKEWSDMHFGSVWHCFKALDADKSGTVRYMELRRALEKYHWPGNARVLFDCLDVRGHGKVLDLEEMTFLDNWATAKKDKQGAEEKQDDLYFSSEGRRGSMGSQGSRRGSVGRRRSGKAESPRNPLQAASSSKTLEDTSKSCSSQGEAYDDGMPRPSTAPTELMASASTPIFSRGSSVRFSLLDEVGGANKEGPLDTTLRHPAALSSTLGATAPSACMRSVSAPQPSQAQLPSPLAHEQAALRVSHMKSLGTLPETRPRSGSTSTVASDVGVGSSQLAALRPKSAARLPSAEESLLLPNRRAAAGAANRPASQPVEEPRAATAPGGWRPQPSAASSPAAAAHPSNRPNTAPTAGSRGGSAAKPPPQVPQLTPVKSRPKISKSPYEATPQELLGVRKPARAPRAKVFEIENFSPELLQDLLKAFTCDTETHLFGIRPEQLRITVGGGGNTAVAK
mmetsp:Transcript_54445/g.127103  ORF Transcript_54445/g.127103 Transcript_54445/m.127103 type:complete len:1075 (+) Transcript_54445:99-3323(+)